ncbi:MAG: cytochrome-c peroxidase, partial [Pirellulales bacterium]|nr:cytochrome-c peroxidase [Pirellulales bacterium]
LATLEEVIDHYAKGGIKNPYLDEEIFLIRLEEKDKADLVAFMKEGLSSPAYPDHQPPELPK